jgi:high affinity Mn2+ porin
MLAAMALALLLAFRCSAQEQADSSTSDALSLHFQQTIIIQNHDRFPSPYSGMNSMSSNEQPAMTLTTTLFLRTSFQDVFDAELDPEIGGGKGLSFSTGMAGFPNGEAYRVSEVAPRLEFVRAYLQKTLSVDASSRLTIVAGKFSIADYFDLNAYSNSPRNQFMNWALINNGAWDYPANTRGYTEGIVVDYRGNSFALRYAAVLEPTSANGPNLDGHISKSIGQAVEGEFNYSFLHRRGKIRTLLFYNTARMGSYGQATNDTSFHHDITLSEQYSRHKYGFGINVEQSLSDDAGAFLRIGWNDGQNETWAYTEIDRTISGGMTSKLAMIGRRADSFGLAFVLSGISDAHREYLNSGGYGFIIGDGSLPKYGPEGIIEAFYLFQLNKMLGISLDYQFAVNPAYNEDRGPVNIGAVRVHFEI